ERADRAQAGGRAVRGAERLRLPAGGGPAAGHGHTGRAPRGGAEGDPQASDRPFEDALGPSGVSDGLAAELRPDRRRANRDTGHDRGGAMVTRERFQQGMSLQQYLDQMTTNKDKFLQHMAEVTLGPEDRAVFASRTDKLNVLVITEDWCGDALVNFPVL